MTWLRNLISLSNWHLTLTSSLISDCRNWGYISACYWPGAAQHAYFYSWQASPFQLPAPKTGVWRPSRGNGILPTTPRVDTSLHLNNSSISPHSRSCFSKSIAILMWWYCIGLKCNFKWWWLTGERLFGIKHWNALYPALMRARESLTIGLSCASRRAIPTLFESLGCVYSKARVTFLPRNGMLSLLCCSSPFNLNFQVS